MLPATVQSIDLCNLPVSLVSISSIWYKIYAMDCAEVGQTMDISFMGSKYNNT